VPGSFRLVGHALRLRPLQRLPITYGSATHRPIEPRIVDSYLSGLRTSAGVRRDFARMLRAVDSRDTVQAAAPAEFRQAGAGRLGRGRQVLPARSRQPARRAARAG
jgi:hypothetical protein